MRKREHPDIMDIALPEDFINSTKTAFGDRIWAELASGLATEAPVSIRLNPAKCRCDDVEITGSEGRVPWCEDGFYLESRPNFTFDPMLHAGLYYVQEASSMFLDRVLRQYGGTAKTALDLCAAPGGKSTVARTSLPADCLLVSNEPIRTRAQILAENMQKFGNADVIVTNNYPEDFKRSGLAFDVVIADVPCSGEGMFRKDAGAVKEWSLQNVEKCWRLQRGIVTDIWECLKPGGLLVYSTCTFNTKENEENVRFICEELGAEVLSVETSPDWRITGSLLGGFDRPVYRFLPGKTKGEGLFMAVMRKHGAAEERLRTPRKTKDKHKDRKQVRGVKGASADTAWLTAPEKFDIVQAGDTFMAVPQAWKDVYATAAKTLKILSAGVVIGEAKGRDVVPSQALALSTSCNTSAFPTVGLDYRQTLSYLRKEAVPLPEGTPRGYVLVTYKGVPIGFEKNIGNRANNLYPAEWKIKSTHTPETPNEIIRKKTTE